MQKIITRSNKIKIEYIVRDLPSVCPHCIWIAGSLFSVFRQIVRPKQPMYYMSNNTKAFQTPYAFSGLPMWCNGKPNECIKYKSSLSCFCLFIGSFVLIEIYTKCRLHFRKNCTVFPILLSYEPKVKSMVLDFIFTLHM